MSTQNHAIALLESRSRALWDAREQRFPMFARQNWEAGSRPAKLLVAQAAQEQLLAEGLVQITSTGFYLTAKGELLAEQATSPAEVGRSIQ